MDICLRRIRATVVQLVLTTVALLSPNPLAAQTVDSLTVAVSRALTAQGLVGVTWSLVLGDQTTVGAAGLRDRERRRAMTPETRIQVGSVAKTLIATGVLRLVTEGRVKLDAPLSQYLPDLPLDNPWEREQPLLVRHLLDHTSGLDDVHLWHVFTLRGDSDAPLISGLVRDGERLQLRYRPGARFSYSNIGFLTLGLLIEKLTGMRYESWLEQELLTPLGMTRSTFAFASQSGAQADTSMAMGYFDGVTPQTSYAIPVRPAAQFATTAQDMATFARFLMGNGVVNGRQLVDSTLLRAMAVPTTTEAVAAGLRTGYALGLTRRERWGMTGKCHLGNIGTFRAVMCLYPEHQRAFFAAYNTDPEGGNFDAIDSLFAASLGVPQTVSLPAAAPTIEPSAWNGWYVVRPNRFAQFEYLDEVAGVTRIAWDGRSVWLRPFQGSERRLEPVGGSLFRLAGRQSATHVLSQSPTGARTVSDGQRTFERVSRARIVIYVASALLGVTALLYLLLVGGYRTLRAWRAGTAQAEALRYAAAAVLLLVLTPLLLLGQPALAIGDPTIANIAITVVTAVLPLAMAVSLAQRWKTGPRTRGAVLDVAALAAGLQWCAVLAAWNLLPLALWR